MKEQTQGVNTLQSTYCRHVSVTRYDDTALAEPSSDGRTATLTDTSSQDRQYVASTLRSPPTAIGSWPAHVTSECQLNGWQEESVL